MDYRTLGRTGVKVSPLCLGAMMFGAWGTADHDESIRIIHRALDAGINFIDTADVYSFGESEEIVGKALAQKQRDEDRPGHQGARRHGQGPQRAGQLAPVDHGRVREQPAPVGHRLHRSLPDPPTVTRYRHRRDARGADRSGARREDPLLRQLDLPGPRDRRGAVGGPATRPGALRHRAAPVLDPGARDREGRAAHVPEVRDGRAAVEPPGRRVALRSLRRRQGEHEPALGHGARTL